MVQARVSWTFLSVVMALKPRPVACVNTTRPGDQQRGPCSQTAILQRQEFFNYLFLYMASPYFFIKELRQFCEASFRVLHFYASWKKCRKVQGWTHHCGGEKISSRERFREKASREKIAKKKTISGKLFKREVKGGPSHRILYFICGRET